MKNVTITGSEMIPRLPIGERRDVYRRILADGDHDYVAVPKGAREPKPCPAPWWIEPGSRARNSSIAFQFVGVGVVTKPCVKTAGCYIGNYEVELADQEDQNP